MTDTKAKAKEMFFEYACRTFFMAHDGVYEEYKKHRISQVQEEEWRREYIALWTKRLSTDDLTAVDRLRDAEAGEALPDLLKWAASGDDFAKLWYANAMWDLAQRTSISATQREQVVVTALDLWQSLIQRPIEISDNHRARIATLVEKGALNVTTPEEYVLNYAKARLSAVKGAGSPS